MSIKVRGFFQSKNHPILLYDKKTRCREVECREGMLVQVSASGPRVKWLCTRSCMVVCYMLARCVYVCVSVHVLNVCIKVLVGPD